ncbi:Cys-tRNA(Pro) deacylase [Acidihalobacter ferrooxydans]|uniref:Cys-tRNA(Pro)/Cys-tRNA(Cys) deacylase n=1 Tax=Acidihalobacter ferrooxydans TaxID=1765967 RepID=A0A1P8UD49_9GAMM|nr:Cys-tRNA(Pro) deacylase [Acidihalobacter ferrooxydans]APZ41760.1 aminoacyl-tRNA deacylase [Acidihalobacter ferrooxydans]
MTPAIDLAKQHGIAHRIHAYTHDPTCTAYGDEAASQLGVEADRVFKTLVVDLGDRKLAVAVLPVSCTLSLKLVARAAGARKAAMADKTVAERATGYVLGGISPLGQKKALPTVIDISARDYASIFVSAGRRGLEIELAADDLRQLTGARFAKLSQMD